MYTLILTFCIGLAPCKYFQAGQYGSLEECEWSRKNYEKELTAQYRVTCVRRVDPKRDNG